MLGNHFYHYPFTISFKFSVLIIEKYECIYSIIKLRKFWQTHVESSSVRKKESNVVVQK